VDSVRLFTFAENDFAFGKVNPDGAIGEQPHILPAHAEEKRMSREIDVELASHSRDPQVLFKARQISRTAATQASRAGRYATAL
jgi:hypothetical protein